MLDHLPPPLAQQNWPAVDATDALVALVMERLARVDKPQRERLTVCGDDIAVQRLRAGADQDGLNTAAWIAITGV